MAEDKAKSVHSTDGNGDENEARGNWSGKLDFILSCVGYAVGLGNVWRFPYKCYKNGGGAFLIPYTLCLAICGLPLFFMELAFGQFSSLGPISIWRSSPFFTGVGWAMVVISGLVCVYYNVVIAWTLFYLFASMNSEVPWATCGNPWNTDACTTNLGTNRTVCNITGGIIANCSNITDSQRRVPSEEYWTNYVLGQSKGLEDIGQVRWQLALCLLLAWVIIFLCLIKGVKSSGKVVYFTAVFPYVVLLILLVRGVTLPGAMDGILFYVTPKWDRLLDATVWGDAATQIFYSLGPAWGGLITMASYNKFRNNCYRDSIIVAIINCGTSVFAGFAIFSVIGFMAHELNTTPDKVVDQGPGLAFIAYPAGLARMPIAPLWSILFFFMLLTLGMDSQFVMLETVISALVDEFESVFRPRKMLLTVGLSVLMFLLGLPLVTNGGIYVFNLMDSYTAGISLMFVALMEIIAVQYVYGYSRFAQDIEMMLGFKPNIYWRATWLVGTPLMIVGIIVFMFVSYAPASLGSYIYPWWGELIGWIMAGVSMICIPLFMMGKFLQHAGCKRTMKSVLSPTPEWGPAVEAFRTGRYANTTATVNGNGTNSSLPPQYVAYNNDVYVPDVDSNSKTQL